MTDILPELAIEGLVYVTPVQYTQQQSEYLNGVFNSEIFPLLTPLRTDTEAFPHIKNLTTYAAFLLSPIKGIKIASGTEEFRGSEEAPRIALVEIPEGIPNIYWLTGTGSGGVHGRQFALLQDVIAAFGTKLFPGFDVEETLLFKVTRDADFAVDEDAGKNFIHAMEDVLIQRKSSFPVQMTCNASSQKIKKFLMEKLELTEEDIDVVVEAFEESLYTKDVVFEVYEWAKQYLDWLIRDLVDEKFNTSPKKIYYRAQILTTTIYNYKEMAKLYKEQTQLGYSKMLPQIALGQSQSSVLANAYFENDVLDLANIFIPPMMSSTMNSDVLKRLNDSSKSAGAGQGDNSEGGRPTNESQGKETSLKTEQNKESQS